MNFIYDNSIKQSRGAKMRRKLVKQGRNALTVTLPAGWVKRYGLKAGEEVEVEEKGRNILIGSDKEAEMDRITLDTRDLNERVIRWLLSGFHKGGYDEIEVLFDKKEVMDIVNELIKELYMGFAIIEQTDKRCLLKNISKDLESEFDNILKRAFLVTLSMAESSLDLIKKDKLLELKNLISLERTNNQLTNFCERILNKKGYKDYKKTCFMYVVAWNLEKVCDDYKYISQYLSENPKIKVNNKLIDVYKNTNNQLRGYYSLLLKFKVEELIELNKKKKEIILMIKEFIKKQSHEEAIISNYLMSIVMKCEDFSTSMFMLNYK